jgi:glycosyltransferase involved in cell wall biosynthesis
MAKERILLVTERFYPEEFLINDLAREIKHRGFYTEVLTQAPSYPFDKVYSGYRNRVFNVDFYKGIKVHRVYTQLGYKKSTFMKIFGYLVFAFLTWVKAFFLAGQFDIIFFYHTGPATMAHSVYVFKKLFKRKCIIWTQDIWPDAVFASGIRETSFRRILIESYLKRLYANFDKVLVSCSGFLPIMKSYYKNEIIHLPQWYPGSDIEATPNIVKDKMQFTFLGNIGSVQNLENVCLGFSKALKSGVKAQLNIVGDGVFLEKLKSLVSNQKTDDIIMWGRKTAEEMPSFIKESNVMIISLKDDPLFNLYVPAKFQGYLIGGRPVFGILNGEVADIITSNKLGLVSNPSDIDSIASGFEYFIKNEGLLNEMGRRSRIFYEDHYTRKDCIQKLMATIV